MTHIVLLTGPESVKQTVRCLHHAFGDLRFEVQDEIATGREFAVRHTYSGGSPATGSPNNGGAGMTSACSGGSGFCGCPRRV